MHLKCFFLLQFANMRKFLIQKTLKQSKITLHEFIPNDIWHLKKSIFFSLTQIAYHVEKGIILKMNHIIHNKERGYHITRWSKSNNQNALNMMNNKKGIKMKNYDKYLVKITTITLKWFVCHFLDEVLAQWYENGNVLVSMLRDDVHPWNNIENKQWTLG